MPVATSARLPSWLASPCAPCPGSGQTHQLTPRIFAASPSPRSAPQKDEDRHESALEAKGPRTFASVALSPPTATSRRAAKERLSRRLLKEVAESQSAEGRHATPPPTSSPKSARWQSACSG